jgi:hypothetical protein
LSTSCIVRDLMGKYTEIVVCGNMFQRVFGEIALGTGGIVEVKIFRQIVHCIKENRLV